MRPDFTTAKNKLICLWFFSGLMLKKNAYKILNRQDHNEMLDEQDSVVPECLGRIKKYS